MPARILVVEDNSANLELMVYLLQAHGHTVLTAVTGEAGLEAALRERPELIVCDVQLPGLSGYEIAGQLKGDPDMSRTPLVAVTAYAMVGDRDKVLAAGFDGYLAKPIDPEQFVAQVEAFLRTPQRSADRAPETCATVSPTAPVKHHRILVVDNQPVNLNLKRSLLEPLGYEVVTAENMTDGLALARQTLPDLIFSDVQMEGGSGYDFIQAVKADRALADIPFIFITSTDCNEKARAKGLALGAARFLFRPLEPELVLAEIEACLRERRNG
jgi:two-component system cell cycle response regulator